MAYKNALWSPAKKNPETGKKKSKVHKMLQKKARRIGKNVSSYLRIFSGNGFVPTIMAFP